MSFNTTEWNTGSHRQKLDRNRLPARRRGGKEIVSRSALIQSLTIKKIARSRCLKSKQLPSLTLLLKVWFISPKP